MNANGSDKKIYEFGEFRLFPHERLLLKAESRVALTPRVLDLLIVLVENHGELVNKETLLEKIWADSFVEEGNINRTVSTLRKNLGSQSNGSDFIETVPKIGYRFIAPVEEIYEEKSPKKSIKKSSQTKYLFAFGVIILLIFAAGFAYFWKRETPKLIEKKVESDLIRLTENQFDEDQAEWTSDNQIRFVRFVTNTRTESWVMNADGTNQRRANEQIKNLRVGKWSPNGKKVVFLKDGETSKDIYLANADGSNETKLPLVNFPNDWSPDGAKFVYAPIIEKSNAEIFVYEIETQKSINLTNNAAFDADPLFSPDGTQITFVSSRDGNNEDYVMDSDGTNIRRLTNHPAVDAFPAFAPDGTQIVFDSNREGENVDIYLKNANDDLPPIKLTNLPGNQEHRGNCWSPDGTKMVITSDQSGKNNIYVLNVEPFKPQLFLTNEKADLQFPSFSADGTKFVYQAKFDDMTLAIQFSDQTAKTDKIIFSQPNAAPNSALSPVISPDGTKIAFSNKIEGNTEICLINADGSNLKNLTNNAAIDASPSFSPDGSEIFFHSNRDGGFVRSHLFRMNSDGANQTRITNKDGYEFSPVLAPDGKNLIFAGDREDGKSRALDIFLLNLENPSDEKNLAVRRFHDTLPAFSPDGKRIVFVSQADGNAEIYLMNSDGSGLLRLTRNTAEDTTPQFSKDGKKIIFSSNRGGKFVLYEILITE